MSNVIDFLERVGQDAHLRYATSGEIANALHEAGIEPSLQQSMLETVDRNGLEVLLGAKPNVCCGIAPAFDEDEVAHGPDAASSLRTAIR